MAFVSIFGSVSSITSSKLDYFVSSPKLRRFLGTQRVARVCQVSAATVAHWIDEGHLRGHRTPTGRRRVDASDLVEFLREHGMPVPPELWEAAAGGARPKVVLVEDDATYRRALMRYLARARLDAELVEAVNGVDGLLIIGRMEPAVIVLDYGLPDLNAAQVIERLLAPGKEGVGAELVVISGGLPEGGPERLRRVGVQTVLDKTAGMEQVVDAVRQALARRAPRR